MELSNDVCERARLSRDTRFDGRFYIGVTSTMIYCRPICPVQPPQSKNVTFFPSAAAASDAGFRPCLRCRPEFSPGTPAWLGTSATVSRALRMIEQGALDQGNVENLADSLGVGSRHLRRLFVQHLGASPSMVAQTRRLHFAKRLIDDTDLSMTEIALASGYNSIRSFNYEFKKTYQRTPSLLRQSRKKRNFSEEGENISVRLPFNRPMDWEGLLDVFKIRAIPGVECVNEGRYSRTFLHEDIVGLLSVSLCPNSEDALLFTLQYPGIQHLFPLVERAKQLFDLAAPVSEIAEHLSHDPLLEPLVKKYPGIRVPGAWDPFENSIRCILGQQISVKAATTLSGRMVAHHGKKLPDEMKDRIPGLSHLFPSPEVLQEAELESLGIIRSRAKTIRTFSKAVVEGKVKFNLGQDLEGFIAQLTDLPGIGPWTANAIAMRAMHNPDAFPASDLVVLKAMEALDYKMNEKQVLARAEAWRPWRAYATMLLWKV